MEILSVLSRKINLSDIHEVVAFISENEEELAALWGMIYSEDRTVSVNALWVLTHLPQSGQAFLESHRDELADMLMVADDVAKKRMLLQLLRDMEYRQEDIRTDLLDYCLSKINSECEPYAVRAFSLHLAYKMCRLYPELLSELEEHLSMLRLQDVSPGLASALRQTEKKIKRVRS